MPFVLKSRPRYTILTDAAWSVAGLLHLCALTLMLAVPFILIGMAVAWWMQSVAGTGNWTMRTESYVVLAMVAAFIVVAGALAAIYDRLAGGSFDWSFETNEKCDLSAVEFVSLLVEGYTRVAYGMLHLSAKDRVSPAEFRMEWKYVALADEEQKVAVRASDWRDGQLARRFPPGRIERPYRRDTALACVDCDLALGGAPLTFQILVAMVDVDGHWQVLDWRHDRSDDDSRDD